MLSWHDNLVAARICLKSRVAEILYEAGPQVASDRLPRSLGHANENALAFPLPVDLALDSEPKVPRTAVNREITFYKQPQLYLSPPASLNQTAGMETSTARSRGFPMGFNTS